MDAPNRLNALKDQDKVTGLDFVVIGDSEFKDGNWWIKIDVHFHPTINGARQILGPGPLEEDRISIRSVTYPNSPKLKILSNGWKNNNILEIVVLLSEKNSFDEYELRIIYPPKIDAYFSRIRFNFQAACRREVDCKPPPQECPTEEQIDFPVDYQARDFSSFRRALLDFASQRYPHWEDRLEADMGIMLVEAMSAFGDEMAYYQDRIGREAHLETATQRRSVRQHARLVDYCMHDGLSASTWLCIKAKKDGYINAGTKVWAESENGKKIFEIGEGLEDIINRSTENRPYEISIQCNAFTPYIWDENDFCRPVGLTELYLEEHNEDSLPEHKWILLETESTDASRPLRRFVVKLVSSENLRDELLDKGITQIKWEKEHAIPFELNLKELKVYGNILPATSGEPKTVFFSIGEPRKLPDDKDIKPGKNEIEIAVERQGHDRTVAYLYSLPGSEEQELAWRGDDWKGDDPQQAHPEISLTEIVYEEPEWKEKDKGKWKWKRSLLGLGNDHARRFSSQGSDFHYFLDDGVYKQVVSYQRSGERMEHIDYASGDGITIRFGDGEFGVQPKRGDVFKVQYRLGNGRRTNTAQDTINHYDPEGIVNELNEKATDLIDSVRNPLTAVNGTDQETIEEVKKRAPYAFQTEAFRAVIREDYAEAAARLPEVQRAGAVFRWTGSWVSAFVTPDPVGSIHLEEKLKDKLVGQLDRFRQAGRETHLREPKYVDLDLEITICVEPSAYPGDVERRVMEALLGKDRFSSSGGFFSADNFTFGTPLRIADLEATIIRVEGVRAVITIKIGRRGWFEIKPFYELEYKVAATEVIRVENDPSNPSHGSVKFHMEGGA